MEIETASHRTSRRVSSMSEDQNRSHSGWDVRSLGKGREWQAAARKSLDNKSRNDGRATEGSQVEEWQDLLSASKNLQSTQRISMEMWICPKIQRIFTFIYKKKTVQNVVGDIPTILTTDRPRLYVQSWGML